MLIADSFAERLNIGIDSFERLIVYSALILREGYSKSAELKYKNYFKITPNYEELSSQDKGTLSIEAAFLIEGESGSRGGDILGSILPQSNLSIPYSGGILSPSVKPILSIYEEPTNITNLEQLFYWACQQLLKANLQNQYQKIVFQEDFKGATENFKASVSVALEYDLAIYLEYSNLIAAVGNSAASGYTLNGNLGSGQVWGSGVLIGSGEFL